MKEEVNAVMLFIAELTGSFKAGSGTVEDKIKCGQHNYIANYLPNLDLEEEEDRKELHEVIWLERLYKELDRYFELPQGKTNEGNSKMRSTCIAIDWYKDTSFDWTVPIEVDATSSMCQIIGVLLNDKRLMSMTNVIGETLEDAWKVAGMNRNMLKKAATPQLYGSSQSCHTLWQDAGISYTKDDIELYTKEMADGPFGLANLFKEFVINNCNPKPEMEIKLWQDTFTISCNRFRNVGEKTKAYKIWDSIEEKYQVVLHTDTKKVPDLKQFKRFFVTCMVHGIDSQIMNTVTEKVIDKYSWGIPIHDAIVISPAAAADTRKWYAEELEKIYENRNQILTDYFKSIGINNAAKSQWDTLKSKVVPFEGEFKASYMALK